MLNLALVLALQARPFTADEIKRFIKFPNPIRQVYTGFPNETKVSIDGKYLSFTETVDDIKTNVIVLLDTGTLKARRITEPYGWKSNPVVLGGDYDDGYKSHHPRQLLALFKKGTHAVFSFDMDAAKPKWTPWLKQEVTDFSLSPFGAHELVMVLGKHGEPGPAHEQNLPPSRLLVQPLKDGKPAGAPTELAKDMRGYFGDPQFDQGGDKIFFSFAKQNVVGADLGMTYVVAKKAGAKAAELLAGIGGMDAVKFGGLSGSSAAGSIIFTRYFKVGNHTESTNNLHQMDLSSRVTDSFLKCTLPVYCMDPVFAQNAAKFYFRAQIGTEAGGLFESSY